MIQNKEYTAKEIAYIKYKIPDIKYSQISNKLRKFWIDWLYKNEKDEKWLR
jgi:hypothetical protein